MDLSSYLKCVFTLLDGRLRDWTMIAVLRDDLAVVQRLAQELVEELEVEQIKNHKQINRGRRGPILSLQYCCSVL